MKNSLEQQRRAGLLACLPDAPRYAVAGVLLPSGGHEFVNKSRRSNALPPRGTLRHGVALTDGDRIVQ
jgi:hypothetical protein